jgi:hypothetical protein
MLPQQFKLPLLCLVSLVFSFKSIIVHAQSSFSLEVQPALTNIDGFKYSGFGGRIGPSFTFSLSDKWSIGTGIGYFTVGNRVSQTFAGGGHDLTETIGNTRLHFGDLEASAAFRIVPRFQISAGPYVSYLFRANQCIRLIHTDNGVTTENSYSENITGLIRQFDFGVRIAASYQLSEAFDLSIMYNQGIQQLSVLDAFFEINQRSQAVFLGIEWRFLRFE